MSWTLTKKLDTFGGPGEIKRREVVLDPQESPGEINCREVELGSEGWTSFASVVTQQQCHGHCPCDCSSQQLKQQLRSTLVATQWRGPHCLNIVVVLAVFHGLLGLPVWSARSSHSHSLTSPPPSLISLMVSVDVKHHGYLQPRVRLRVHNYCLR